MARDDETAPRIDDQIENLHRLDMILPAFGKALDPAQLAGRTSFRPMSPDRLPLAGPLLPALDEPSDGLHILSGFGARGLVWATLTAELLASRIAGEPLPLEADLIAAAEPARFLAKPPRRHSAAEL
jgi:tRNA 5-methylaminomethyl-2-thiouridine biosynthesis bifunctional protein